MKYYAPNSPFDRQWFGQKEAERWARQGRARLADGLVFMGRVVWPATIWFEERMTRLIRSQAERDLINIEGDAAYEAMIDLQRSGGTAVGSHARWGGRPSGGMRVMQMRRVWPVKKTRGGGVPTGA